MGIKFNNPFKPSKTYFDVAIKIVGCLVIMTVVAVPLGHAVYEKNNPTARAEARANYILAQQSESLFRSCLLQAHGDVEELNQCKADYIARETK
uniref:Uncharacterized protein n=1 Tax=Pseudomonas phage RVTF4 TaxID=3236931 RepID=A0AB39CCX2_9VIRU